MLHAGGWFRCGCWLAIAVGCGGKTLTFGADGEDAPAPNGGQPGGGTAPVSGTAGGSASAAASPGSGGASPFGGVSSAGTLSSAGTTPASEEPTPLLPRAGAPSPVGDGRLPDLPETRVGSPGTGWDRCHGGELLSSRYECVACPAARGTEFFVAAPLPPLPVSPSPPEAYFYFEPPLTAEALWLDVAWLSGPRSAQLSLWETDAACRPLGAPRTFDLAPLLSGGFGAWQSACIPLDETRELWGLGFRVDADGRLGLDALRFGPPCR